MLFCPVEGFCISLPKAYNFLLNSKNFIILKRVITIFIIIRHLNRFSSEVNSPQHFVVCRCQRVALSAHHCTRGSSYGRHGQAELWLQPGGGAAIHNQVVLRWPGVLPLRAEGGPSFQGFPSARHPCRRTYLPISYTLPDLSYCWRNVASPLTTFKVNYG